MNSINKENVKLFTYENGELCRDIKGIVIDFHGLGGGNIICGHSDISRFYAGENILMLSPYDNPWSWMNDIAVNTVNLIVKAVIEKYDLDKDIPIVLSGGSMGGLSAFIYSVYSPFNIIACAANSPVCDLVLHYNEREDLPHAVYSAFSHYGTDLGDAIKTASPIHMISDFKDIPYYIVHGYEDQAVSKSMHSDRLAEKLTERGLNLIYDQVRGMEHCDIKGKHKEKYYEFIVSQF